MPRRRKTEVAVPTILLTTDSPYTMTQWPKGAATIEGDFMTFDVEELQTYNPLQVPTLPRALAEVTSPAKIVRFVELYGLLHAPARQSPGKWKREPQPVMEFLHAAEWIRKLLHVQTHFRRATQPYKADVPAEEIRADGIKELRRWFTIDTPSPMAYDMASRVGVLGTDDELTRLLMKRNPKAAWPVMPDPTESNTNRFLWSVANWLTWALSLTGLSKIRLWASVGFPNESRFPDAPFDLSPSVSNNLIDFCCYHIFNDLRSNKPARRCADFVGCTNWFIAEHDSKQFCSTACAARDRKRRSRKKGA